MKKTSIGGLGLALAAVLTISPLISAAAVADPLSDTGADSSSAAGTTGSVDDTAPAGSPDADDQDPTGAGDENSAADDQDPADTDDADPADEGDDDGSGQEIPDYPVQITSITPVGFRDPGFTITWTVDEQTLSEWAGDGIEGFAVFAYQPSGLVDGHQTFAGVTRVGFTAGGATVRGGGSASYIYPTEDPVPADITQAPLGNTTPYQLLVLPTYHGYVLPAVVGATEALTNGPVPAAPIEPTTASAGGVTATVVGGAIVATLPQTPVGTWVYGYAFSSPVGLGWTQVAADGTATWSVPSAGLANGLHHLAVIDDSGVTVGSAAFRVGAAVAAAGAPRALAATGASSDLPLGLAAALVLAGASLITVRRVRGARAAQARA